MSRHPGGRTCNDLLPLAIIMTVIAMLRPSNWSQIRADVKRAGE